MHLPDRRLEIDGARALAVLLVVVAHTAETTHGTAAAMIAGVGSRGVDLFFVLSGFCLAYPILCAVRNGKPVADPWTFMRRRLVRIAPPYYVALGAFALLALTPFGLPTWPLAVPPSGFQVVDFVHDAVFATTRNPFVNADFWTLGIEMHWYLLFPVVIAVFVRSKVLFGTMMFVAILLGHLGIGMVDLLFLPTFVLGIVAAEIVIRRPVWLAAVWPTSCVLVAAAVWQQCHNPSVVDHGNSLWQIATFTLLLAIVSGGRITRVFSHPLPVAIGVASYSIYLVHHPIVSTAARYGVPLPIAAFVAILAGAAFWYGVERPLFSPAVRRALDRTLLRSVGWLPRPYRRVPIGATAASAPASAGP